MMVYPDFRELLTAFAAAGVRYLVVGGYAVSFHDRPRTTKDLDLWIDGSAENLDRVAKALAAFGAPPGLIAEVRSMGPTEIVYFGKPPLRVDLIRGLADLDFDDAFSRRVDTTWEGAPVSIVGKAELILSKRAAGRPRDRQDLRALEGSRRKR